ncbi:MAG TPA: anti-sigma B factor antagonist [Janthinobacterium sp.]|nr:anti-sigma B factor antagonist [Janthinobacterium sp.]
MSTAQQRKGGTACLRIVGEMTIYRAAELKGVLLAALEQPDSLDIDLSGVTEFDSSGVQLLMLAKRQARQQHQTVQLLAHSPAVLDVLELFNLAAYFGDPLVIAASPVSASAPGRTPS